MHGRPLRLLAVLAIALPVVGSSVEVSRVRSAGRLYTVGALWRLLTTNPRPLVGHTVRVQGIVDPHVIITMPGLPGLASPLSDPNGSSTMLMGYAGPDPLLSTLRRVPVLGTLVPPPQQILSDHPAVYRMRLEALPRPCLVDPCVLPFLVDAVPPTTS
jgi:hypothetical protein